MRKKREGGEMEKWGEWSKAEAASWGRDRKGRNSGWKLKISLPWCMGREWACLVS